MDDLSIGSPREVCVVDIAVLSLSKGHGQLFMAHRPRLSLAVSRSALDFKWIFASARCTQTKAGNSGQSDCRSPDEAHEMTHSSLNLVPPAPFPQPLASDVDDIPAVIVDEADLPTAEEASQKNNANNNDDDDDNGQVEPLASHPQGVDAGEADKDHKVFNVNDDGIIRDSLTLGELRRYVEGAAFKAKVAPVCGGQGLM
jgi:hypothetical protein